MLCMVGKIENVNSFLVLGFSHFSVFFSGVFVWIFIVRLYGQLVSQNVRHKTHD